jgi:hypothetical protein
MGLNTVTINFTRTKDSQLNWVVTQLFKPLWLKKWKWISNTCLLTYWCDRIFIFLFVALHQLALYMNHFLTTPGGKYPSTSNTPLIQFPYQLLFNLKQSLVINKNNGKDKSNQSTLFLINSDWNQVRYHHSPNSSRIQSQSIVHQHHVSVYLLSICMRLCLVIVFLTYTKWLHYNIIWGPWCTRTSQVTSQSCCWATKLSTYTTKTLQYQQHIHHLDFSYHRTFKQKKVQFPVEQIQVIPSHISQPLIKTIKLFTYIYIYIYIYIYACAFSFFLILS